MISEHPLSVTEIGNGGELRVGETLRILGATYADENPELEWHRGNTSLQVGQSGSKWTTISGGETKRLGRLSPTLTWSHDEPGEYEIRRVSDNKVISNYTIKPANGKASSIDNPDDYLNVDDSQSPSDIATNNPGIVPADNEQGIALAPELRRAGADLGPQGATVTLPDGDTVEVGQITESDEVARYLDGEQAGDVVGSDQQALNDPTSSGGGSGGGMIGAALGILLLLVAGGAALLGGDD